MKGRIILCRDPEEAQEEADLEEVHEAAASVADREAVASVADTTTADLADRIFTDPVDIGVCTDRFSAAGIIDLIITAEADASAVCLEFYSYPSLSYSLYR